MLSWFARLPIRGKLLAMVLLPLAVALPLTGIVLLLWADTAFDRLLVTKVRSDLAVAHGYFERVLAEVGASAETVAESHGLRRDLADRGRLSNLLLAYKARELLDFVELRDPQGRLVASTEGGADGGETDSTPLPARNERTSIELLGPEDLARVAPALAPRVPVPLLANITEFGKTPLFTTAELGAAGVRMVLYPLSAFRAMNAAALRVFEAIRRDGTQRAVLDSMQTRAELYEVLRYHEFEQRADEKLK